MGPSCALSASQDTLYHMEHLGTSWVYTKTAIMKGQTGPKQEAVRLGLEKGHKLFLEAQVAADNGRVYRRFGSYPSLKEFAEHVHSDNHHMFEILLDSSRGVKLYFDLEDTEVKGKCVRVDINAFIEDLQAKYLQYFDVELPRSCIYVSNSGGLYEKTALYRQSYHVVVYDGMAASSVREVKNITMQWFADCAYVDKAVYGGMQSFRMINNSKASSARVLMPEDRGTGYFEHSPCQFRTKATRLNMKKFTKVVEREDGIRAAAGLLPAVIEASPCPVVLDPDTFDADDATCLLQVIPNSGEQQQPFQTFWTIGLACLNCGVPYNDFKAWAAQSDKHLTSGRDQSSRLYDLKPSSTGYNLSSLRKIAMKARPGVLGSSSNLAVAQCMYPMMDLAAMGIAHDYNFYEEDTHYVSNLIPEWEAYPHLILRSMMGTGKTTKICKALSVLKPPSVLILTCRRSLAATAMGTYRDVLPDLTHYIHLKNKEINEAKYLVCQLESIHKVTGNFDTVIVDESESNLNQFHSSTTQNKFDAIWQSFERIMSNAKRTVWADAFVTDRSLQACLDLTGDPARMKFLWNKKHTLKRKAVRLGNAVKDGRYSPLFQQKAHELKLAGKEVFMVSAWKKLLLDVAPYLPQPVRLIHGGTSEQEKALLADPDAYLEGHRSFGCTTALTVGTNVTRPMDVVLLHSSCYTGLVRDVFQSQMRVRHLRDNLMYYMVHHGDKCDAAFPVFSRGRLQRYVDGEEMYGPKLESIVQCHKYKKLCKALQHLYVFNQQERNVSTYKHLEMFNEYLKVCGYNTLDVEEIDDTIPLPLVPAIDPGVKFDLIDDITHETYTNRFKEWRDQLLPSKEADEMLKHDVTVVKMIPAPLLAQRWCFEKYIKSPMVIEQKLAHVSHETGINTRGHLAEHGYHDLPNEGKLKWTSAIVDSLGIAHTQEVGVLIDRHNLQKTCELILENVEHVQKVFKIGGSHNGLATLNLIFNKIGFTRVASKDRKQKMQKGVRKETGDFTISPALNSPYAACCITYFVAKHLKDYKLEVTCEDSVCGLIESEEAT